MIPKIGFENTINYNMKLKLQNKKNNTNFVSENPINKDFANAYKNYNISFGGTKDINSKADKTGVINNNMTPYAEEILNDAKVLAKQYNNPEVTQSHILYVGLNNLLEEIKNINKDTYSEESKSGMMFLLEDELNSDVFKNKEMCNKIIPIIKKELKVLQKDIETLPKNNTTKTPSLSKEFINDTFSIYEQTNIDQITAGALIDDEMLYRAAFYPCNKQYKEKNIKAFQKELKSAIYFDDFYNNKTLHIPMYDEKAKNIWKNLSIGTDMIVIHDVNTNPQYILKSLAKTFHDKNNSYGNMTTENTDIKVLNKDADIDFWVQVLKDMQKDKNKNHVIIIENINDIIRNTLSPEQKALLSSDTPLGLTKDSIKIINELTKNVKLIILTDKDYYYKIQSAQNSTANYFSQFCEANIPILNTNQTKELFKVSPDITKNIKKQFAPSAIQKCVEISNTLPGNYPEKTLQLMDKISAYYIDKKRELTVSDVQNYMKEAGDIFKTTEDSSSVKLVFDTGKKIKDIIGKDSTKKEAQAIVKQIKSNKMGTKGVVIFSQDGSVGAGRRHTAQAIAGEAKIPYVEINTMDFGTKDVDLFGGGVQSPEASMKKLFSMVKAQAEENKNKSAVLFIENFEYFSVGELVSEYHQKAMAQLLREMDNAEKQGLNILVMGSVSNPDLIGEAAMKSFKFIDSIEVASPSYNSEARYDILKSSVKKNKMKIAGTNKEEQDKVLKFAADITQHFPYIYIQNIVKKAQTVAFERGHKEVEKADFTEAYLQITTGRPSIEHIEPYEKELTTSHECGHATNLEVMNSVAKKLGKPWHIPTKVNFVTLDPRGYYGGAVYKGKDKNNECSFEYNFASIVCSYGGHSAEKAFYNMDGSYGISIDLEQATNMAQSMVQTMGQGPKTGKISLEDREILSANLKNTVESDEQLILKNALTVSDMITEEYAPFNKYFTDKYSSFVGTGECLIDGDTFRKELSDWRNSQSEEKQKELNLLDKMIIDIMAVTKQGKIY